MYRIVCYILLIVSLACATNSNNESPLPLPSGKQVLVISIISSKFPNGDFAVELNYRTKIPLENRGEILSELNEVWSTFKSYAERQGATSAIIRAHEPAKGFIIKKDNSEAFVYKKVNGKWVEPSINGNTKSLSACIYSSLRSRCASLAS